MDWKVTWYTNLLCIKEKQLKQDIKQQSTQPMYKDDKNENMKRKTLPKNSTKRGFPVIPQALNKHYRDLRRLNKHKFPPSKHQTKQNKNEQGCTWLFW